ncbi:MAG: bifunctional riboflavin kinase/FAD synthetase [Hespellia sp.]|nr:bifunctional riboflavin kinase/FAD synthetase [Hespellia sp.]
MELITELSSYHSLEKTAVTLGKFDGLHKGHHRLIEQIQQYTTVHNSVKSVVFVMDMTRHLLDRGITRKLLMTNEERQLHLKDEIDCLIQLPFTHEFASMEAEEFIEEILIKKLHAEYIVVGTDYRFGHQAKGDVDLLAKYAKIYHYHLEIVAKERYHDRIISSTYIRECLMNGNSDLANELLGYPYQTQGIVEHGKQLGRTLGFPTMNVTPDPEKLLPKNGVHFCNVQIDGIWYHGIGNVGMKPTVKDDRRVLVEVFVLDYQGDAYDKHIRIEFCEFLRSEKKFSSVEELKTQVDQDIMAGKKYFTKES